MKILLDICFVGTAYHGYQVQPNANTVQQQLNIATRDLFGYDCDIIGCSRTDSGVHANQFCATVSKKATGSLETNIPIEKIPVALSLRLPDDISVKKAAWVDDSFHARYDVVSKEYLYCIWNGKTRNPFWHNRCWHYPKTIDDRSLKSMNDAASRFIGTHDFATFMAANSSVESTVRTIYDATVYREDDAIYFKVSANGFLYNMVRILMGTLISVAEGKITPEQIDIIILSKDRSQAGITAPPQGLYLNKVIY